MFKIHSFDKSLKYEGKILFKKSKKYTGTFFTGQKSGKQLCLSYKNGLLTNASKTDGERIISRSYKYDSGGNLINVKKNNEDIFVKEIKHNIGLEYTRQENINNVIGKTFDNTNRLIKYVISPKLIFGFIKYLDHISVDTRYFLNKAKYLGNGHIQLRYLDGDPVLNNGIVDKTIIRDFNKGSISVITSNGHGYKGSYKSLDGQFGAELNYFVDKNGKPIRTHIEGNNNKWSYDKEISYDDFEHKVRETFSECGGKWFTENSFDIKGNVILSKRLNSSGKIIQTTKLKYNKNNLPVKESVYNQNGNLVESTDNTYYRNNKLKTSTITYFDNYGSYKNIYEYDKNNHLLKFSEVYDDLKTETFYDKNECIIKFIEKDSKDKIKYTKEYINDDFDHLKTIIKDSEGKEVYHIEHSKFIKKDIMKNINTFKTPDGKLIGKEFITHNNNSEKTNIIYTDKYGKRIKYKEFCTILGFEV